MTKISTTQETEAGRSLTGCQSRDSIREILSQKTKNKKQPKGKRIKAGHGGVHPCGPSYSGGRGRRIAVQGQPRQS
jgi:hypothetical protein